MGEPVRVSRGVWRASEQVADLDGLCAALLSCLPAGSVVAGLSAARLHGLWLPGTDHAGPVEFIVRGDVDVPRRHARSERREVRTRRRTLRPDEVTVVRGLPVTTIERTWTDLAEQLLPLDLVAAGDSTLRSGCTESSLVGAVRRAGGRRGITRARTALPLLDRRSRSRPESHLRVGLVTRGLAPSGVNEPVYDDLGQWLGEPDVSFDDARLAVEYNGALHAAPGRMRRDMTREIDFDVRGGWDTITLGPAEVFRRMDRSAAYIARVRSDRLRLLGREW